MTLMEWLAKVFYPCAHQWEIVEKLRDRPKNPSKVTIVRGCTICGELDTIVVEAPKPSAEPKPPEPSCPPHKWKTVRTIRIVDDTKLPADKQSTMGWKLTQQCEGCGDVRTVDG